MCGEAVAINGMRFVLIVNVTRITDLTYFAKVMRGLFLKCATSKPPLQLNVIDVL